MIKENVSFSWMHEYIEIIVGYDFVASPFLIKYIKSQIFENRTNLKFALFYFRLLA